MSDECPPRWSRFNSSCYRGFSSPDRILSYTEAQVTRGHEVAASPQAHLSRRSSVARPRPAASCPAYTASQRQTSSWSSARARAGSGPRRESTSVSFRIVHNITLSPGLMKEAQSLRINSSGQTEVQLTTRYGLGTEVARAVLQCLSTFSSNKLGKSLDELSKRINRLLTRKILLPPL